MILGKILPTGGSAEFPYYVNQAWTGASTMSYLDIPYPSGIQAGDILLLMAMKSNNTNDTLSLGSGLAFTSRQNQQTNSHRFYLWSRIANGTETGSRRIQDSASQTKVGAMLQFRGASGLNFNGLGAGINQSNIVFSFYNSYSVALPMTLYMRMPQGTPTVDSGMEIIARCRPVSSAYFEALFVGNEMPLPGNTIQATVYFNSSPTNVQYAKSQIILYK